MCVGEYEAIISRLLSERKKIGVTEMQFIAGYEPIRETWEEENNFQIIRIAGGYDYNVWLSDW